MSLLPNVQHELIRKGRIHQRQDPVKPPYGHQVSRYRRGQAQGRHDQKIGTVPIFPGPDRHGSGAPGRVPHRLGIGGAGDGPQWRGNSESGPVEPGVHPPGRIEQRQGKQVVVLGELQPGIGPPGSEAWRAVLDALRHSDQGQHPVVQVAAKIGGRPPRRQFRLAAHIGREMLAKRFPEQQRYDGAQQAYTPGNRPRNERSGPDVVPGGR